jgi:hypothetical protein
MILLIETVDEPLRIQFGTFSFTLSVYQASAFAVATLLISALQRQLDPLRKNTKPNIQLMVNCAQWCCFASHIAIAMGLVPSVQNAFRRKFFALRFVEMMITYPLMLMSIEESSKSNEGLTMRDRNDSTFLMSFCLFLMSLGNTIVSENMKVILLPDSVRMHSIGK